MREQQIAANDGSQFLDEVLVDHTASSWAEEATLMAAILDSSAPSDFDVRTDWAVAGGRPDNATTLEPSSSREHAFTNVPTATMTSWDHRPQASSLSGNSGDRNVPTTRMPAQLHHSREARILCWQHGCNGRTFANFRTYQRHCRERSDGYVRPACPRCGQCFLRDAARDLHLQHQRCRVLQYDANGVLVWVYIGPEDAVST